jgi:chromosome partitioning protein
MSYAVSQSDLVIIPLKEQQQDAQAAIDVIKEIMRDMKAVRREIPYSVLFTMTKVVAKSRTARSINRQFRMSTNIDTFNVEINERDAFAAIFATGGAVRDLPASEVNNLEAALLNTQTFANEVISKLRENRIKGQVA